MPTLAPTHHVRRSSVGACLAFLCACALTCGVAGQAQEEQEPPSPLAPKEGEWRLDGRLVSFTQEAGRVRLVMDVYATEPYASFVRLLTPAKRKTLMIPATALLIAGPAAPAALSEAGDAVEQAFSRRGVRVAVTGPNVDGGEIRCVGAGNIGIVFPAARKWKVRPKPIPVPALLGKSAAAVNAVLGKGTVVKKDPVAPWIAFKRPGTYDVQVVIHKGRCRVVIVRGLKAQFGWESVAPLLGLPAGGATGKLVSWTGTEPRVATRLRVSQVANLKAVAPKHDIHLENTDIGVEVRIGFTRHDLGAGDYP